MESLFKPLSGAGCALLGLLAPVQPLICCALICVSVDFITGVLADRKRAQRGQIAWRFESVKAWRTIRKLVFICGGIVLTSLIDATVAPLVELHLANLFTGFVCGVECWSYLENAAIITNHPAFRLFRTHLKNQIKDTLNHPNHAL